ncbi:dimethylhistidine N-methyltransferase [Tangfeifania diversioriginum]|uniref:Dimethylhistidine N-methyltransferase n=1 Tax=Tangfeifania diversioriginum TaxID=1168035 RepID=A0A1M6K8B3_9BACT|nr:L-histidine N(alpha)-methyltransferase [Tangfeifania diversioriginum]SHJ55080.1 dimethylhistidine N-methyltransferase [Tangfeifania diversioriginum]
MEQKLLLSQLATDTLKGLSANPKYLLSKYFYDDMGSAIFQDIMHMPEYYLTNCEHEIFSKQKNELLKVFSNNGDTFNLVELGSGDGSKTKILLHHIFNKGVDFQYLPIDISQKTNDSLAANLKAELPGLIVKPKTGDYFNELQKLTSDDSIPKVIFFLGSNIGNFSNEETAEFLGRLSAYTNSGDKVLIGFDLKKSPTVILKAYNDPHGHSRRFIFNHLHRLNRELDAAFDPQDFVHHCTYNPESGELKNYLIAKTEHNAQIDALEQVFHFEKWEPVFMELSRKFDLETIGQLATDHGFEQIRNFTDSRNYFVDSLWERI